MLPIVGRPDSAIAIKATFPAGYLCPCGALQALSLSSSVPLRPRCKSIRHHRTVRSMLPIVGRPNSAIAISNSFRKI